MIIMIMITERHQIGLGKGGFGGGISTLNMLMVFISRRT